MPDVLHSSLGAGEIHEPKGVTTATTNETYVANGAGSGTWSEPEPKGALTATANQIYISDGAGSGAWTHWPFGWGNYKDAGAAQVFSTTSAKVSIDGAAASTNESYLPQEIRGSGSLWDTSLDKITPMYEGDLYHLRIDLPFTAKSGAPNTFTLEFDISGAATPTTVILTDRVGVTGTPPFTVTLDTVVFVGSTFAANGLQLFGKTDTGTMTVTNPGIVISREGDGNI